MVDCYHVFLHQQRCEHADPARSSAAAAGATADGRDHRRSAHHWLARQRLHCLHLSGGSLRLARGLGSSRTTVVLPVLWIRIGFNEVPDPAFYLNADADPDPGSKTNTDADAEPGRILKSLKF